MATAAEVMAAHGIKRPDVTLRAAAAAGLELAAACVMLLAESGGGRMVWGHDPVDTGGTYTPGGPVTQGNYLAYRAAMRAGRIGRQGVGDCQLTSAEFQDRGDAHGGCWDPYANQLAGFLGLAERIRAYGLRNGFRAYNGSGPAAEAYADARMRELTTWRTRLAGATTALLATTTSPPRIEEDDDVQNIPISGTGRMVVDCPTGAAAASHRQTWLSVTLLDPTDGKAWVQVFAQADTHGVEDWRWSGKDLAASPDNNLARAWKEIPDGVTKLVISWDLTSSPSGVLCLETKPAA